MLRLPTLEACSWSGQAAEAPGAVGGYAGRSPVGRTGHWVRGGCTDIQTGVVSLRRQDALPSF